MTLRPAFLFASAVLVTVLVTGNPESPPTDTNTGLCSCTLTATNPGAAKYGETDLIMIDNFLETLANAAMPVAARRPNDEDEE